MPQNTDQWELAVLRSHLADAVKHIDGGMLASAGISVREADQHVQAIIARHNELKAKANG